MKVANQTLRENKYRKNTNEMGRWFPGERNKPRGLKLIDDDGNDNHNYNNNSNNNDNNKVFLRILQRAQILYLQNLKYIYSLFPNTRILGFIIPSQLFLYRPTTYDWDDFVFICQEKIILIYEMVKYRLNYMIIAAQVTEDKQVLGSLPN